MKNQVFFRKVLFLFLSLLFINGLLAQDYKKKKRIGVISLNVTDLSLNSDQAAKLLRNAIIELDTFEVIDEFDMVDVISESEVDVKNCFSTKCLIGVGADLNADYMFTGSIEKLLNKIVVSLRVIDVKGKRISKRKLVEYIFVEERLKDMISLTLKEMMSRDIDKTRRNALVKENQYESNINTPNIGKLSLSGPRIGFSILTGEEADVYKAQENAGGFDGRPVLFQFGYQYEVSYLNAGKLQALFEIIPMISGVDQGRIIPSLTLLNGVRMNTNGFEFAVGPTFNLNKKAEGYYDSNGDWNIRNESAPSGTTFKRRLDSRGDPYLDTGLVFALGKSFKSGRVNFPVNLYAVLKKKDIQFGISFGFNASSIRK